MVDETGLIAGFYEAAFDAGRLPDELHRLGDFAGGTGGAMLLWDRHVAAPALLVTTSDAGADAPDAYRRHYARIDPYRPLLEVMPANRWTSSADYFDDSFVAKSAFYNEYLIPRGIRHVAAARIVADAQFDAFVGIHRGRGDDPFSADDLRRFERVGRHLGRAVALYLDVTRTRLGRAAAAALPDQLTTPAVLVDEAARVLFANPAAEALLAIEGAIGIAAGRLSPARGSDERQLSRLVGIAATQGIGGEMLIRRQPGEAPIGVLVTPAGPVTTLYNLAPVAAALVLLQDRSHRPTRSIAGLRGRFDLTKTEAALAQSLLDGKRLTDVAAGRHVSIETVRTQLRSLFRKTGATRQADLMRILLATPEPPPDDGG
jgi:DNA-binding CsgD family transcriptional regulator